MYVDFNLPDLTINEIPDHLMHLLADQTVLRTTSGEGFTAQTVYNDRGMTIATTGTSLSCRAQSGELQLDSRPELTSYDDLVVNHMVQCGEGTVIDDGAGLTITLLNVGIAELRAAYFTFK